MKKSILGNSLLMLFLFCLVLSCQNELRQPLPESNDDGTALLAAKNWYDNRDVSFSHFRIGIDSITPENNPSRKKLPPDWKRNRKEKLDNEYNGIIVETDTLVITNENIGFFRVFIFKEKNNKIYDGRIVEFYGENNFIRKNFKKIPRLYRNKKIPGFSGAIMSYDIDYNYLEGYSYKNGEREKAQPMLPKKKLGEITDPTKGRTTGTFRTQLEDEGCWDVYWETFQFNCMCITSSVYMYSYCALGTTGGTSVPLPPGGSDGNGGGTFNTPVGPSTPTGQTGILNTVKDPCINSVWDMVKSSAANNVIQQILYDFNLSQSIRLTFKEEFDPTHPKRAAYVSGTGEVCFNTYALAYAKQEAILTTIIHEVLHVYLNGCSQFDDHNFMGSSYIGPFATYLKAYYPNLSTAEAEALAWFGLGDTGCWYEMQQDHLTNPIIAIEDIYFNWGSIENPKNGIYYGTNCW